MATRRWVVLVASIAVSATGCQAPPPSPVIAFGDNKHWIVIADVTWTIGSTNEQIVVPRGFVTDFTSIPAPFQIMGLGPQGQYSRAAVIHDYLYWSQGCTREQADRLMVIAMKESNTSKFQTSTIYKGLKDKAGPAWEDNRRQRMAGRPKIVPQGYLPPPDPNMTWTAYREVLVKEGVKDPAFAVNPSYCELGDTTEVP